MVSVNNSTSGAEAHLPFGGNGKSGNGARQSGPAEHRFLALYGRGDRLWGALGVNAPAAGDALPQAPRRAP